MGIVQASSDITNIPDDKEKFRFIQMALADIMNQINGNLEVTKNIKCSFVNAVFSSANTNTPIHHGLGRVPSGYIEYRKSAAMIVYDGTDATNNSVISLKSSAAGTVKLLFF